MSTYVMADIHGCYDEFQQMLNKIKFNPEVDELIIAGDIVDRGPQSYEMLEYARSEPKNVKFVKGNHDVDFAKYCDRIYRFADDKNATVRRVDLWNYGVYDHYLTVEGLVNQYKLNATDFQLWSEMFSRMPYYLERQVGDKKYIIVHGGYATKEQFYKYKKETRWPDMNDLETFYVWAREEGLKFGGEKGSTIIFGHTPTIFKDTSMYQEGKVFKVEDPDGRRFINIDCGLVYKKNYEDDQECKNGNLACIRLEDEKIFYFYE